MGADLPRWIRGAFLVVLLVLPVLAVATFETAHRAEGAMLFTRAPIDDEAGGVNISDGATSDRATSEGVVSGGFDAWVLAGHLASEQLGAPSVRVDALGDRFTLVEVMGADADEVSATLDRAVARAVDAPPPGTAVVPVHRSPAVDFEEGVRGSMLLGVVLPTDDPDWITLPGSAYLGAVLGAAADGQVFADEVLDGPGSIELRHERWDDAPMLELAVTTVNEADALPAFSRTVERLRAESDRVQAAAGVPSDLRSDLVVTTAPQAPTRVPDQLLTPASLMVLWVLLVLTWLIRALAITLHPLGTGGSRVRS